MSSGSTSCNRAITARTSFRTSSLVIPGITRTSHVASHNSGMMFSLVPPVIKVPGAIVGAGSVVTKDIKEPGVYIGNPAKKTRDM